MKKWRQEECPDIFKVEIDSETLELKKEVIKFKMKTGKQDQVFGAITTKQIANELEKLGYKIDKKRIILAEPINSLGYHDVTINLHKKVQAIIKLELIK